MANKSEDIANNIMQNVATTDLSIFNLISQSDIVVKAIMIILTIASIWCWTIIFDKWLFIKRTKKRTQNFEKIYRTGKGRTFETIYEKVKKKNDNPFAAMLIAGMLEIKEGILKNTIIPSKSLIDKSQERIDISLQRIKNVTLEKMEKDLTFLATVGSSAPFIGLFGTVWGIVNSFQAIAVSKNTSLAIVAPGIAEALLVTAIGLAAAIPAVIFYNLFSNEIRKTSIKLDGFSHELSTLLIHNIKFKENE